MLWSRRQELDEHVPAEEFPAIRKVYELYGKEANTAVVQFNAPHNLNEQSRNASNDSLRKKFCMRPMRIRSPRKEFRLKV